jgi:hypothetical protein
MGIHPLRPRVAIEFFRPFLDAGQKVILSLSNKLSELNVTSRLKTD